jgi:hypothetical protein
MGVFDTLVVVAGAMKRRWGVPISQNPLCQGTRPPSSSLRSIEVACGLTAPRVRVVGMAATSRNQKNLNQSFCGRWAWHSDFEVQRGKARGSPRANCGLPSVWITTGTVDADCQGGPCVCVHDGWLVAEMKCRGVMLRRFCEICCSWDLPL